MRKVHPNSLDNLITPRRLRVKISDEDLFQIGEVVRNYGKDVRGELFQAVFRSLKHHYARAIAEGKRDSRYPSAAHGETSRNRLYKALVIEETKGDVLRLEYRYDPKIGTEIPYAENVNKARGEMTTLRTPTGREMRYPNRRQILRQGDNSVRDYLYSFEVDYPGREFLGDAVDNTSRNMPAISKKAISKVRSVYAAGKDVRVSPKGGAYYIGGSTPRQGE